MPNWLIVVLGRLIVPPLLPPLDLPVAARLMPPVRRTVESVCRSFFWIGVSQGFWLGLIVGIVGGAVAVLMHQSVRSVCRAATRLVNAGLDRLDQPREPLP